MPAATSGRARCCCSLRLLLLAAPAARAAMAEAEVVVVVRSSCQRPPTLDHAPPGREHGYEVRKVAVALFLPDPGEDGLIMAATGPPPIPVLARSELDLERRSMNPRCGMERRQPYAISCSTSLIVYSMQKRIDPEHVMHEHVSRR
ncbi:hypothetical protein ZWY2020_031599 [Hordeum vulgare]|nr:hypothetical protein ZWY2020_031599 [Hordeum vulgare]